MATMPTFVKRSEVRYAAPRRQDQQDCGKREEDLHLLRPLPGEDIFFFSKRIDNSRVVRLAAPGSRGATWSAAGAMCLLAVLFTAAVAPRIASYFDGYRLEALRQEHQRLIDERMMLDVEEAKLLRLDRLQELARHHHLFPPKANQVVDLEPKGDKALAELSRKSR
jgi:hypothetical protein